MNLPRGMAETSKSSMVDSSVMDPAVHVEDDYDAGYDEMGTEFCGGDGQGKQQPGLHYVKQKVLPLHGNRTVF